MRARRLRPSFDTLSLRITPTDVTPVATAAVAAPADTSTTCTGTMPGSTTTVVGNLGDWQVGGTPQVTPVNVLQTTVDTTTWAVVSQ